MMKVIEGHFNPLRRPDRTIYSCCLTKKVQLDSDERKESRVDRGNKTAEAGVVSLSQSHLNMQGAKTYKGKDINAIKLWGKHIDSAILNYNKNIKTKVWRLFVWSFTSALD